MVEASVGHEANNEGLLIVIGVEVAVRVAVQEQEQKLWVRSKRAAKPRLWQRCD